MKTFIVATFLLLISSSAIAVQGYPTSSDGGSQCFTVNGIVHCTGQN